MPTEEDLALMVQQGDQHALATLVESYHRPLFGFLYHLLGSNSMLAEDLAQETFLRMIRSIATYRYPRPFKSWLYAIAANLARDHYKQAETRHTETIFEKGITSETSSAEELLINADEAKQVVSHLKALPHQQREAIMLRYYHELSLNEIADTLNVPIGTVKSRLSLGLRRLRVLMEQL